jgi:hypothetical protein
MAFVVARRGRRFEIRESIHTPGGPRARTLANFAVLNEEVLARAKGRARRPFDVEAVRASALKAGAAATPTEAGTSSTSGVAVASPSSPETRHFVQSSRRLAASLRPSAPSGSPPDPGDTLIDLLNFAEQIGEFTGPSRPEPLRFPPLGRLAAASRGGSG